MFRILSLAGGGLRGAYAIGFLSELEAQLDGPLTDYFDLIAGASTGGITASALCYGISANDMQLFYEKHGADIFSPRPKLKLRHMGQLVYPMLRRFVNWQTRQNLDDIFRSRYSSDMLESSMIEGFGMDRISDVRKCRLIIPAVNLTDGMNDPGLVAMGESARILRCHDGLCSTDSHGIPFDSSQIRMLSIGTGQSSHSLSPPGKEAGVLYWARHVIEVMNLLQVQGAQFPLKVALGDRYHQFDFELKDKSWALDNVNMIEELFVMGREEGKRQFDALKDTFFAEKTEPYQPLGLEPGI